MHPYNHKFVLQNFELKMHCTVLFLLGGLVGMVIRENDVLTIPEYKDRLEPLMKQLEDEGKWTMLERTIFPGYLPGFNGVLFVFKITKAEC